MREKFPTRHDRMHSSKVWDESGWLELQAGKQELMDKQQKLLCQKQKIKGMPDGPNKDACKAVVKMLKEEIRELDTKLGLVIHQYRRQSVDKCKESHKGEHG